MLLSLSKNSDTSSLNSRYVGEAKSELPDGLWLSSSGSSDSMSFIGSFLVLSSASNPVLDFCCGDRNREQQYIEINATACQRTPASPPCSLLFLLPPGPTGHTYIMANHNTTFSPPHIRDFLFFWGGGSSKDEGGMKKDCQKKTTHLFADPCLTSPVFDLIFEVLHELWLHTPRTKKSSAGHTAEWAKFKSCS